MCAHRGPVALGEKEQMLNHLYYLVKLSLTQLSTKSLSCTISSHRRAAFQIMCTDMYTLEQQTGPTFYELEREDSDLFHSLRIKFASRKKQRAASEMSLGSW